MSSIALLKLDELGRGKYWFGRGIVRGVSDWCHFARDDGGSEEREAVCVAMRSDGAF